MAGQKRVVRWLVAAAVVAALSGCASVPDAIKGTTPTPQQDLVRVMNAPQLYVGQEARFGGKVASVQNQQGKPAWKLPPFRSTAPRVRRWANRRAGVFLPT